MADNQKEYSLLISIVTGSLRKYFPYFVSKRLIQDQPFRYGVRIKNIGTEHFPGGTIKDIELQSTEGKGLSHPCSSEFHISGLNPNKEEVIWLDQCRTPLSGIIWVRCSVKSDDGNTIVTYQLDEACREKPCYPDRNKWGDSLYLISRFDYQQERTNNILIFLTIITLLQGIWGIKNVLEFIIRKISEVLIFVSNKLIFLLSKIS